ncbi:MAG: integrase arm-type DNA-binding domain-containing protein [Methyloceanibacter sp.]
MAKKHLTDRTIQNIKSPAKGQLEIFDLGYSGLAVRVSHGGVKSFVLFYRSGGKLKRETLGRWPAISLAAARDAWRKTREAIAKGEDPSSRNGAKSPTMLLDTVIEEWLRRDQSKNKPSSLYQVTRSVDADILPAWRGRRVDEITKRDVIELLDAIADRGAPLMARRVQTIVRRFFNWCIERDILKSDPTAGMPKVGNCKSRERVLNDDELAKVWRAAEGSFGSVVRLLALTGARREEIGQLRWSEIDGDSIKLEGARTKTGTAHIIPLSAPARALLNTVPRISGSEYVFGAKPISGWSRHKAELDTSAAVTGWRIHDLRRTVATGMQKLGVGLQTVEAVLGHTSGSRDGIVGVYQRHDFANEKRAALEAWGQHVMRLLD